MGLGKTLGGVRDQVSRDEGVLHADMAHRNAVADRDGRDHDGHAARLGDAELDGLGDLVQVHVAGDDLIIGTDDADERLCHLLPGESKGIEQTSVGRLLDALLDVITEHIFLLSAPFALRGPGC